MIEGTHDGNLITNQSFVGETLSFINGKTFAEVELKDYLNNHITPIQAKIRTITAYGTNELEISNGANFIIGRHTNGGIQVVVSIESGYIKLTFETPTTSRIVDSIGTLEFLEVITENKTYNEFKFQD